MAIQKRMDKAALVYSYKTALYSVKINALKLH